MKRISNPPNCFTAQELEWLDGAPEAHLEVYEERAKSIVNENSSPDIGFRYSVNPYRGCFHACAYCYARPTHQYIDFGAGSDFERKIVVKVNAPELLTKEFEKKNWCGEEIVFSGITDCYQPLEAVYQITRQCLEVCLKYRNPVGIITKGCLIERDLELLAALNRVARVKVYLSIAFVDDALSKLLEPHAPRPSARFRAMRALASRGIPVGIGVAPIIPSLNDVEIPEILRIAKDNGAESAFMTLLRLPTEVAPVFTERVREALPGRSEKILNQLKRMREGKLNNAEFGRRMSGRGEEWEISDWLFRQSLEKLGYPARDETAEFRGPKLSTFQRPNAQLRLPGM